MELKDIYEKIQTSVNAGEANGDVFFEMLDSIFEKDYTSSDDNCEKPVVVCKLIVAADKRDISVEKLFNIIYWGYSPSLREWLYNNNVPMIMFLSAACMYIESKVNLPMFTSILQEAFNDFSDGSAAADFIYSSIGATYKVLYD